MDFEDSLNRGVNPLTAQLIESSLLTQFVLRSREKPMVFMPHILSQKKCRTVYSVGEPNTGTVRPTPVQWHNWMDASLAPPAGSLPWPDFTRRP